MLMPYTLSWEEAGVYRRYCGDVSVAERRASFDRICGDVRFDDLRYAITDYLEVQEYEITESSTRESAAMHLGPLFTNPRIVIAAVAVRSDIVGAIREAMELGLISAPYRIFSSVDDARNWIASCNLGIHGAACNLSSP
jgi:hypothetical protein